MFTWLTNRLVGSPKDRAATQKAEQLYAAIVAQARQPDFYQSFGAADTIPGRFEIVTLHMFIVLDRLADEGELGKEPAQQVVDVMFLDMDDVARETGVGDMGVGPRIKKLARSFQSRLEYYKLTIDGDESGAFPRGTLVEAILEIHYKNDKEQRAQAERLAAYVVEQRARIADMSLEEVIAADTLFSKLNEKGGS